MHQYFHMAGWVQTSTRSDSGKTQSAKDACCVRDSYQDNGKWRSNSKQCRKTKTTIKYLCKLPTTKDLDAVRTSGGCRVVALVFFWTRSLQGIKVCASAFAWHTFEPSNRVMLEAMFPIALSWSDSDGRSDFLHDLEQCCKYWRCRPCRHRIMNNECIVYSTSVYP